MPKIRKDVQGYGMTRNNFVFYSFWLFITLFSGPYGLLDHSGALQKTADLAMDVSDGLYPLEISDGLVTETNLATDLPTDNIPSLK